MRRLPSNVFEVGGRPELRGHQVIEALAVLLLIRLGFSVSACSFGLEIEHRERETFATTPTFPGAYFTTQPAIRTPGEGTV